MKKIISAGLATILAASALTTAAFAEDVKITAEGIVAKPAIKVTMPKTMAFVFNPYKLSVDIKGKIVETGGSDEIVVCSYNNGTADAAGDAWAITTDVEGVDLKAAIYAYAENKADAKFKVVDSTVTTDDTSTEIRSLKLTIQAQGVGDAKTVTLQNEALDTKTTPLWTEANKETGAKATKVDKFNKANPLKITMTGETKNVGQLTWEEKDTSKVNFLFSFEYADPTE